MASKQKDLSSDPHPKKSKDGKESQMIESNNYGDFSGLQIQLVIPF